MLIWEASVVVTCSQKLSCQYSALVTTCATWLTFDFRLVSLLLGSVGLLGSVENNCWRCDDQYHYVNQTSEKIVLLPTSDVDGVRDGEGPVFLLHSAGIAQSNRDELDRDRHGDDLSKT